jgi:hypothetical protein
LSIQDAVEREAYFKVRVNYCTMSDSTDRQIHLSHGTPFYLLEQLHLQRTSEVCEIRHFVHSVPLDLQERRSSDNYGPAVVTFQHVNVVFKQGIAETQ